jgi:hypothetical protein
MWAGEKECSTEGRMVARGEGGVKVDTETTLGQRSGMPYDSFFSSRVSNRLPGNDLGKPDWQ